MKTYQIAIHVGVYNLGHPADSKPLAQRVAILRGACDQALSMCDDWRESTRRAGRGRVDTLREQLAELLAEAEADQKLTAKLQEVRELLEVAP